MRSFIYIANYIVDDVTYTYTITTYVTIYCYIVTRPNSALYRILTQRIVNKIGM